MPHHEGCASKASHEKATRPFALLFQGRPEGSFDGARLKFLDQMMSAGGLCDRGDNWRALDGTLDPAKVEQAADNALIGDAPTIAATMIERFHPDDRIMAWFDFFNHDSERVKRNMTAYMERVVPLVEAGVGQR